MAELAALAARLDAAAAQASAIPQLTKEVDLTLEEAYDVQAALIARRLQRGDRLIGLKMGLTSKAKMAQVGVDEVIWGRITEQTAIPDGGSADVARYIHPRVEPEVAFLVEGSRIAAVAPALELIDSRYLDFQFTLPDVVADNTSAAGFVLGPWSPVPADLANLGVLLEVDGKVVQNGSTAAILGDPRRAFAAALRLAGQRGVHVEDGWIVLAGAATAAVPLQPGSHVRAVVQHLGTASLRASCERVGRVAAQSATP